MFIVVIALIIAAVVLTAAYICYHMAFSVPKKLGDPRKTMKGEQYDPFRPRAWKLVEEAMALEWEDVYITSHDGLKLRGRYHEADPDAPIQLMMHGYRSVCFRDFSGGIILAAESGYNMLLVDQRAHGDSEGKCLTFGIEERRDCLDWINYVNQRFGPNKEIVLVGVSMGAATVLMAAGEALPENVKGVVADSGYSSPREIIRKVMREMHCPVGPVYPFLKLGARIFGGFDLEEYSAPEAMKECRVPILFIHGDDDRFVPYEMCVQNHAACVSEKYFLTVPGAGHALSYMVDTPAYEKAVTEFLGRIFR